VGDQPSSFGRRVFGYRRSSVDQAISDRDMMLRQAEQRAREADARAAEMEERMAALHRQVTDQQVRLGGRERELSEQMTALHRRMGEVGAELAERDRAIVELEAHIDRLTQQPETPRPEAVTAASERVSQEVARILSAAEDSAARIVEQARITAAHNTAVSQRQWREVQRSLARFAGWRDRVEPQMVEIHARLEELRSRIGEIPERVRAAFAPLADASAATEAGLQALFDDLTDPLVRAPSPARDDAEFPGAANGPGGSHSELAEGPRAAGSIP